MDQPSESIDRRAKSSGGGARSRGGRSKSGRSRGRKSHGRKRPHVKASCRKLKELGKTKRFNRKQRNLFWAEYGRHCDEEMLACETCGITEEETSLSVCSACLGTLYCSKACQLADTEHYQEQ